MPLACFRGEAFFHYACFLRPSEVEHAPTRLFFKKEVFQAALEDCALIKNIIGRCCILHMKDYCSSKIFDLIVPSFILYFVVCSHAPTVSSPENGMLCHVYSYPLYLHVSARHIRLQVATTVIHIVVWGERVTNSFQLILTANRTEDPCGMLGLWAAFTVLEPPRLRMSIIHRGFMFHLWVTCL